MIVHSKAGKGVETMSESTHIHYRVDAVSKADLEEARPISTRLSEMLLAEPTSIEVQDVLQNCYLENRWISCSCSSAVNGIDSLREIGTSLREIGQHLLKIFDLR